MNTSVYHVTVSLKPCYADYYNYKYTSLQLLLCNEILNIDTIKNILIQALKSSKYTLTIKECNNYDEIESIEAQGVPIIRLGNAIHKIADFKVTERHITYVPNPDPVWKKEKLIGKVEINTPIVAAEDFIKYIRNYLIIDTNPCSNVMFLNWRPESPDYIIKLFNDCLELLGVHPKKCANHYYNGEYHKKCYFISRAITIELYYCDGACSIQASLSYSDHIIEKVIERTIE